MAPACSCPGTVGPEARSVPTPYGPSDDGGAADVLTGGLGKDWFLTFAGDTTDAVAGETVTAH